MAGGKGQRGPPGTDSWEAAQPLGTLPLGYQVPGHTGQGPVATQWLASTHVLCMSRKGALSPPPGCPQGGQPSEVKPLCNGSAPHRTHKFWAQSLRSPRDTEASALCSVGCAGPPGPLGAAVCRKAPGEPAALSASANYHPCEGNPSSLPGQPPETCQPDPPATPTSLTPQPPHRCCTRGERLAVPR